MEKIRYSFVFFVCFWGFANAQQTIGLFVSDTAAYEGYTLFQPMSFTTAYLIDNCGKLIHSWPTDHNPGNSFYLLPNGDLLRPCKIANPVFSGGGSGGYIERRNWNNNVLWYFQYSDNQVHQHHDIEVLPNGNILLLAWELKSNAECIAAGRNPAFLSNNMMPEHIVEIQPLNPGSALIVWEWHAWDHLVQDFDSSKANFGIVSNHPELIDLNYNPTTVADFMHGNSIDYHPGLDQIMISLRDYNEIWIIDHSTSSAEAASHGGGIYGKGGDLLYRWGNPAAYNRGSVLDKKSYAQHDAHWIPDSLPDGGKIMFFNNGVGRPSGSFSSIDIIEPQIDGFGDYSFSSNNTYLPDTLTWTYMDTTQFYSTNVSNGQRMPNGNTLICQGFKGRFFEVDTNGQILWEYINPVNTVGPMMQGNNPVNNSVFKVSRYDYNYPAFNGRNLSPQAEIEIDPIPNDCSIITALLTTSKEDFPEVELFPSGFSIENPGKWLLDYELFDLSGRRIFNGQSIDIQSFIDLNRLESGIYLIRISTKEYRFSKTTKFIKLN